MVECIIYVIFQVGWIPHSCMKQGDVILELFL